jgi:hypothetical protein
VRRVEGEGVVEIVDLVLFHERLVDGLERVVEDGKGVLRDRVWGPHELRGGSER